MNTIVTETTEQGEIAIDIFQKLSNDRILFVCGDINDEMAADISATLLLKDGEDSNNKITLFINSTGGNIRDVLAIYDVMRIIDAPVETVCIGAAMRESALLLAAGTKGMRLATKHSVIAIGQLINDAANYSDLIDAKIHQDQIAIDNKRMMNIFAKCTNKPLKEIVMDLDRKKFMSSNQALKYGLIDGVVGVKRNRK